MGIPGLRSFSWAFNVGGVGFFCIRRACWFLWKIKLHCFNVFVMCVWYLLVGSKGVGSKLFSERKVLTFSWYSRSCMMTTVLPLSAYVIIALFLSSLLCMFFTMCSCHLCILLMLWWVLCICESFLAVMMWYASWILGSSSLIACSVSRMRVVHCVSLDCWMQYCIPRFSSSCSSDVKLIFVRLIVQGRNICCWLRFSCLWFAAWRLSGFLFSLS